MKHLKKFNENNDEFDMSSSHLDDDSIHNYKEVKENIKRNIENLLYDISGDLEDFTIAVSGQIDISDTLNTDYGDYKYEMKITRIN
jgi:hypothetical protein